MKTKYILIFILVMHTFKLSFAVNPNCELYINNRVSGINLYVKFYPVSSLYNGNATEGDLLTEYTVRSETYVPGDSVLRGVQRRGDSLDINKLKYIVGLDGFALNNRSPYPGYFELKPDSSGIHYDKWLLLGNDASLNTR